MQNGILHPAQPTRTPAQVSRRIRTNITYAIHGFWRFLGTFSTLTSTYGSTNGTTRCRMEFCTQHNQREYQHKSAGESGQTLHPVYPEFGNFWRFLGTFSTLTSTYASANGTTRCRIEFSTQHNQREYQHKSAGESGRTLHTLYPVFGGFWEPLVP